MNFLSVPRRARRARLDGFTLIELMIVISIIGVLAAIAVPSFQKARQASFQRACYANQKVIIGALVQYNLDNNTSYDTNPIEWADLQTQGYLRSRPDDPGGGPGDTANNYKLNETIPDTITCITHGPIDEPDGS